MLEHELDFFIRQSNEIEGIHREVTSEEMKAHEDFLRLAKVKVEDMVAFVAVIEPGARLRNIGGLNVRVGSHRPPSGGPEIEEELRDILNSSLTPWKTHLLYESLHPFTDGNGRSGRVFWLWMRGVRGLPPLSFLQAFYYSTLAESR